METGWGNPKLQNFRKKICLLTIYLNGDVLKTFQDNPKKKSDNLGQSAGGIIVIDLRMINLFH